MQFLENSVIGLRAARHRLQGVRFAARITLFPMVHLGEAEFFRSVHADAMTHDFVLVEGVRSRYAIRLTRAYRWAAPGRLGLVEQPRFVAENPSCCVVHADVPGEQFDAEWAQLALHRRLAIELSAAVIGLGLRFATSRERIGKYMSQDDLPTREEVAALEPVQKPLIDIRDRRLCKTMQEVLEDHGDADKSIAVIYGAGHMPGLVRFLRDFGDFRVTDSEWSTVFGYR